MKLWTYSGSGRYRWRKELFTGRKIVQRKGACTGYKWRTIEINGKKIDKGYVR